MKIHLIPVTDGITQDELAGRIQAGWVHLGQMLINGSGVLDPTKPMTQAGQVPAEVWVLPEPMVPAGVIVNLLVSMSKQGLDLSALDALAQALLGQGIRALVEMVAKMQKEQKDAAG